MKPFTAPPLLAVVWLSMSVFSAPVLADSEDKTDAKESDEPKRGDFDAGGRVRLPNGPDDMGQFATFNWIAVDAFGRYLLFDSVALDGHVPLAVWKPDSYMGADPRLIGGMEITLDARIPEGPFAPKHYETKLRLQLTGAYMREGAMLLGDKDFPLFVGSFHPGFRGGVGMRVRLSSVVDFSLSPSWVYQAGSSESVAAVQIPTSTIVRLGELVAVSADLDVLTGDGYSFGGEGGGRIAAGGSLTVQLGRLRVHAGAGVASLLTGGLYPTIRDSFYVDLNVKFVK